MELRCKTRRIMLKISLKQGQYVNIGDNIRVVYVGGTGNHGRLMIDAPKDVRIARSTVEQNPERRKDTYYLQRTAGYSPVPQVP